MPISATARWPPPTAGNDPHRSVGMGGSPGPVQKVAGALARHLDVLRLGSLLALRDVELDLLPFLETAVTATCDRAEVHEHIWATFDLDETVALVAVEPLHRALRHLDLLRSGCGARHRDGAQRLSQLPWPASPARRESRSSVTPPYRATEQPRS